jgi:hypothetical protein
VDILLGNGAAFRSIRSGDEDGLVMKAPRAMNEFLERRVRLHEIGCRQLYPELGLEIGNPLGLMLPAAVGK